MKENFQDITSLLVGETKEVDFEKSKDFQTPVKRKTNLSKQILVFSKTHKPTNIYITS